MSESDIYLHVSCCFILYENKKKVVYRYVWKCDINLCISLNVHVFLKWLCYLSYVVDL